MRPVDDLADRMRAVVAAIEREAARHLAGSGITAGEWALLRALHGLGAVPPSALGRHCGLTRGGVTRLVDRLRTKRLVVRAGAGGDDARYRTIALTGAGVTLVVRLSAGRSAAEAAVLAALPDRDRTRLRDLPGGQGSQAGGGA